MKNPYYIILSLIIILSSCGDKKNNQGPSTNPGYEPIEMPAGSEKVISSSNTFGIDIFKQIAASGSKDSNLFVSPVSISLALAMTRNGASGNTLDSMTYALRMEGVSDTEINTSYRDLINGLTTVDSTVQLSIANSIWYNQNFTIESPFLDINRNYYNANVQSLDFNSPEALNTINGWVDEQTHHKIPEIISELSGYDAMVLINAIYFKGVWKIKFDTNATMKGYFFLENGNSVNANMMHLKDTVLYQKNDLFQALKLNYGSGNFGMVILLPDEGKNCNDILNQMNPDKWESWMSGFSRQKVNVALPQFKFAYKIKLKDMLKKMGMGIAFGPSADFTRISSGGIYIGDVIHKAFVEVNEGGTEAAAATAVVMVGSAAPTNETYFTADKPFLFAIVEQSTKSIVFMGRLSDPSVN